MLRSGDFSAVKLRHLIGQESSATKEDPLKGFSGPEGLAELSQSLTRIQSIVTITMPDLAADVVPFVNALFEVAKTERGEGTAWLDISLFYASVFAKVSRRAERFALAMADAAGPVFDLKFITQQSTDTQTLFSARLRAISKANGGGGSETDAEGGASEAKLRRQVEQQQREIANLKRKHGDSKGGDKGGKSGVNGNGDVNRKMLPKGDALKAWNTAHPGKDNKPACFHFIENAKAGGCTRGANCKFHHPA